MSKWEHLEQKWKYYTMSSDFSEVGLEILGLVLSLQEVPSRHIYFTVSFALKKAKLESHFMEYIP